MRTVLARFLAGLGLALLASSALCCRRTPALSLPERLARCTDDFQRRLYA